MMRVSKVFAAGFWVAVLVAAGIVGLVYYMLLVKYDDKLSFGEPLMGLGLLAIPLLIAIGRWRNQHEVPYSSTRLVSSLRPGLFALLQWVPLALRGAAIGILVLALTRPEIKQEDYIWVEGIDIVVVLDTSQSMMITDIRPSRIAAGKENIKNFLKKRKNDQVGLVVFGRETMVQAPLTSDYRALADILKTVQIGDVLANGTALGDGLAMAIRLLNRSKATSKVVVLMSDGESNTARHFAPREAMDLAVDNDIRVFTMLLGRGGFGLSFGEGTNPRLLRDLAEKTDGSYFVAGDSDGLEDSFLEIRSTLEKDRRKIPISRPPKPKHFFLIYLAAALFAFELLCRSTRWRFAP